MTKQNLIDLIFKTQTGDMSISRCAQIITERMRPKNQLEIVLDNKMKAPKDSFASKL